MYRIFGFNDYSFETYLLDVSKSPISFGQSDEKFSIDGLIHKLPYHYGSSDAEQSFPSSASFITMYRYNITYSCVYIQGYIQYS